MKLLDKSTAVIVGLNVVWVFAMLPPIRCTVVESVNSTTWKAILMSSFVTNRLIRAFVVDVMS